MTHFPHGKHLIAGQWLESTSDFYSNPAMGAPQRFYRGTAEQVNTAVLAAEAAFWSYREISRQDRAIFLESIADEIEARGDAITTIGVAETALPALRLQGERARTCGQLRLFAQSIRQGDYLDKRHDVALPDRQPLARADLKLIQRPIGPVAVFGASNFPLAFSTAGGDTASALAAGCPVVVKGHPAHPGTAEIVAEAIHAAIQHCQLPAGVFSLIQDDGFEVGHALVTHPLIKAVGFTGSLAGGRALFDLCAARKEPIPFFGELGSINPMFLLPNALAQRTAAIAKGWSQSLTMGAGQFCTNPGVAIVLAGLDAEAFIQTTEQALRDVQTQTMLTDNIAKGYQSGQQRMAAAMGITTRLNTVSRGREALPALFSTTGDHWLDNPDWETEVFGPLGLVVIAKDEPQMLAIAQRLEGQLTCTLHLEHADIPLAQRLMPILERKAGRLLANAFPTGVEVCDSMVHGGPYPASTNFGATSVGTMAIRRFLRPICYQDMPDSLLPERF